MKRLQDFSHYEIQKFNDLRRILQTGKIPAYLLNPSILLAHNEKNPQVAHLHESSEVSIDSLLVLVSGDGIIGVNARAAMRGALRKKRHIKDLDDDLPIPIRHDPVTAKLHAHLDVLEDNPDEG